MTINILFMFNSISLNKYCNISLMWLMLDKKIRKNKIHKQILKNSNKIKNVRPKRNNKKFRNNKLKSKEITKMYDDFILF